MFACLYLPPPADAQASALAADQLLRLARDFSPRVEAHTAVSPHAHAVTLDVSGLTRLLGDRRAIGAELRRTAAGSGLRVHVAVASTATASILLASGRPGLTVVPAGGDAEALAPLPLAVLESCAGLLEGAADARAASRASESIAQVRRWGLRTLGDLAALPAADLAERLGQPGLQWQRWACGEDARPLVPAAADERFESSLDLEWPLEGLEPLSFVLARLFEPLCDRLARADRGAVGLHLSLTLTDKRVHERQLELPAPMRDARVLRTLALLDLESNPPPAGVDRVRVALDVAEGRVLQFGLFARALPADTLATLLARLGALMGPEQVGAPALVDSYRPGAFAMAPFDPAPAPARAQRTLAAAALSDGDPRPLHVLRRLRSPIPARVTLDQGRPARVATDRRGFAGGGVAWCEGPWRSSGEWWQEAGRPEAGRPWARPWDCDEWDVALGDGTVYRVSQMRGERARWFIDGIID